MSNIEQLLRRYGEGNLSPEELSELNQLTHRNQVLESAQRQAKTIHRRRNAVVGIVAVFAVTGGIFFARPSADNKLSETPMVARTEMPSLTEPAAMPSLKEAAPKRIASAPNARQQDVAILQQESTPIPSAQEEQSINETAAVVEQLEPATIVDETIVACNTECSPDSVINDIWKFLRT